MSADGILARLLLDIGAVVIAGQVVHVLLVRLGQPRVLSQLVAGIALGPTLLGRLPGDPSTLLFPRDVRPALSLLGGVGLTIFAFVVGLELDLGRMRNRSRLVVNVSAGALALPLAAGTGLAIALYDSHRLVGGHEVPRAAFVLFLATATAVTAFPVLAAILVERGIRRSALGELAIGSAAIQDVVGWTLLAAALAVLSHGGATGVLRTALASGALVVLLVFVARPALDALLHRQLSVAGSGGLALAVAYACLCAGLTQLIGVHEVLGAFVAGATFPREKHARASLTRALLPITFEVLLPVYFLIPGLAVNAGAIGVGSFGELALIIAVSCLAKLLGAAASGRCSGLPWSEVLPLAVALNARGLMEIVVLTVGYTEGVLDPRLFSEFVLMAVLTTMMTGPLLDFLRRRGLTAAGDRPGAVSQWDETLRTAPAIGLVR